MLQQIFEHAKERNFQGYILLSLKTHQLKEVRILIAYLILLHFCFIV